jgi:hypothetical protein
MSPRRAAAPATTGASGKTEQGSNGKTDRTARAIFGRHSRSACCLRSGSSQPCPRCCRHFGSCDCPAFAEIHREVA